MNNYKSQIQETISELEEIEGMLYSRMINLAMVGDLREINEKLEVGETMRFKFSDFEKLEDPNIQMLIQIFNSVGNEKERLVNLYPETS